MGVHISRHMHLKEKLAWAIDKWLQVIYHIAKAEKPSVRLSVCLSVTPISQPCQHGLKRDLLKMKAESSGKTKYFLSLHVHLVIHTSALKALV